MIRDHKNNNSMAIDFRSAAPAAALPSYYKDAHPLHFVSNKPVLVQCSLYDHG